MIRISLVDLIGPFGSVMWVVALLFMPWALAVSSFYRERWQWHASMLGATSGDLPLRQAHRAQFISDTLDNLVRWSYYAIGAAAMINFFFAPPMRGYAGSRDYPLDSIGHHYRRYRRPACVPVPKVLL